MSKDGKLKIHKIVGATDPGHAVNPALIERQVAGSFVYGLSAMMYGECNWSRTAPSSRPISTPTTSCAWTRCPRSRRSSCPPAASGAASANPISIAVAAPAVLNAIFAATGKRITTFPLMNHDLRSV